MSRPGGVVYRFLLGPTRAYGISTPWRRLRAAGRRAVRWTARELNPATAYHYRLIVARCLRCRVKTGADRAFRTQPPPLPPDVTTGAAPAVQQTSAVLTGSVDAQGQTTRYAFEYGPTTAYGSVSQLANALARLGSQSVSLPLGGLSPVTTYHYRLVAANRHGTTYGADATFSTTGYYRNPVYAGDAPDPFVLSGPSGSDFWAFVTGEDFPLLHSSDLVSWSPAGTALTTRPAWVVSSGDWHPWAPSVLATAAACPGAAGGPCYVMYYTGLSAQYNVNCIGVATSSQPQGPYVDQGPLQAPSLVGAGPGPSMPIGCGDSGGEGNIDPSPFVDPVTHQPYLYVSTDRSCTAGSCQLQPTISVIPLTGDLMQAAGGRTPLFSGAAGSWEAAGVSVPTVEGPSMAYHDGTYYLLYSGGSWQAAYGMGYATSSSPTGPFAKWPGNPVLQQTAAVLSPGGGDRLVAGPHGNLWLVYAARSGSVSAPRALFIDPVSWTAAPEAGQPDVLTIAGPTSTPQPLQP